MQKKQIQNLFLFFFIFVLISSNVLSDNYWTDLTVGQGDQRYCRNGFDCIMDNLIINGNLSIEGDVVNISVININTTGNIYSSGNITADGYFVGDGSLLTGIASGGASVGGNNSQVQFNINGTLRGDSRYRFNYSTGTITSPTNTLGNIIQAGYFGMGSYASGNGWLSDNIKYQGGFKYIGDAVGSLFRFLATASGAGFRYQTSPFGSHDTAVSVAIDTFGANYNNGQPALFVRTTGSTGTYTVFQVFNPSTPDNLAQTAIAPINGNGKALVVFGVNGQNANIMEIQNGTGGIMDSFTNHGYFGINTATPTYPITVNANGTGGVSIWTLGGISIGGNVTTRTTIYDKSKGSALSKVNDADYYKNSITGEIDHTKFYGYTTSVVPDLSRPVTIVETDFVCDKTDKNSIGKYCYNVTAERVTYPYTTIEEGVSLNEEVDLLRQALYELKLKNDELELRILTLEMQK